MSDDTTRALMRRAIAAAVRSVENGNLPYGCVLVNAHGDVVLEGENTIATGNDALAHAETNLVREATGQFDREYLANCTIYTSDEPCPMCASAIFWGGIGSLVFGLSKERFDTTFGPHDPSIDFHIPCRDVLAAGKRKVDVIGPLLEEESLAKHGTA